MRAHVREHIYEVSRVGRKHTLCEPAQSKSKRHFISKFARKLPDPNRDTRFVRACAVETHMATAQGVLEEPIYMEIYRKGAGPGFRGPHFLSKFRGKNAHGDVTRAMLCANLQEKCWTLIPGSTFCARLRNRNADGHFTRGIFCSNLQEKMPQTTPPTAIKHRAFYLP